VPAEKTQRLIVLRPLQGLRAVLPLTARQQSATLAHAHLLYNAGLPPADLRWNYKNTHLPDEWRP